MACAKEKMAPDPITFNSIVVDVSLHPGKNIIAAGDIDGDVTLHSYSITEDNHEVMSLPHHKKACRCVEFSSDGNQLLTASKDRSLCVVDLDKGKVCHKIKKAHESAIYSMCIVNENMVATGDDDGMLKVWDLRHEKAVMELSENDEFISDMALGANMRTLLATNGDGTLTAFDIRKHKMKVQSELFDSEMLSVAIMKGGNKVVCGDGDGHLNIFNWGEWGFTSDSLTGHPLSVDCIVPINDDIICTGSLDGIVRAVNILPNRFLGLVGSHDNLPVENMDLSHCGTYLASCSHDQKIKFWNVTDIKQEEVDITKKARRGTKKNLDKVLDNDFFAGLSEEKSEEKKTGKDKDEDSDEDSEEDDSSGEDSGESENDSDDGQHNENSLVVGGSSDCDSSSSEKDNEHSTEQNNEMSSGIEGSSDGDSSSSDEGLSDET